MFFVSPPSMCTHMCVRAWNTRHRIKETVSVSRGNAGNRRISSEWRTPFCCKVLKDTERLLLTVFYHYKAFLARHLWAWIQTTAAPAVAECGCIRFSFQSHITGDLFHWLVCPACVLISHISWRSCRLEFKYANLWQHDTQEAIC